MTLEIPVVQAILFMNHGEAAKAVDVLKAGELYDKGTSDIHFTPGRGYLLNHQPAQATQEFQAVLNLRGAFIGDPLMGLAQLCLARGYAQQKRCRQSTRCLSGLSDPLERCRPRYPNPERSKVEYAKLQ